MCLGVGRCILLSSTPEKKSRKKIHTKDAKASCRCVNNRSKSAAECTFDGSVDTAIRYSARRNRDFDGAYMKTVTEICEQKQA
jgi:hypothetical protein